MKPIFKFVCEHLRTLCSVLAGALLISLSACGGGGGGYGSSSSSSAGDGNSGSLRMAMTDAPSCGYDAVNITVAKVRVNQNASAADTDAGWSEITLNPAVRLNLLSLNNGVLADLGQTSLGAGTYTQLRLVLADNTTAAPLANSVIATGGSEVALKTPSGQQSGVKANINIAVAANQMADFVIDFDACKSVVSAGASGNFLLKPVVTVVPRLVSGVTGYVDIGMANGNTTAALQQSGVVVKSTPADSTGKFMLQPVAAGTYTLVVTAPGRTTTVITGVAVTANTVTAINTSATPLNPPASAQGSFAGTVSSTVTPIDSTVRVLQSLTTAGTIEIANKPVDSVSGAYNYFVVINAPLVAAYVAGPGALVFAPDVAATAKYSLEANSNGALKTAGPFTAAAGIVIAANFTFP